MATAILSMCSTAPLSPNTDMSPCLSSIAAHYKLLLRCPEKSVKHVCSLMVFPVPGQSKMAAACFKCPHVNVLNGSIGQNVWVDVGLAFALMMDVQVGWKRKVVHQCTNQMCTNKHCSLKYSPYLQWVFFRVSVIGVCECLSSLWNISGTLLSIHRMIQRWMQKDEIR